MTNLTIFISLYKRRISDFIKNFLILKNNLPPVFQVVSPVLKVSFAARERIGLCKEKCGV
jgi:hypothetical protein